MENNMVGWFEIPVADMDRAKTFYNTVFNIEIQVMNFGGTFMGWFPFAEEKPGVIASNPISLKSYGCLAKVIPAISPPAPPTISNPAPAPATAVPARPQQIGYSREYWIPCWR